VTRLLCRDLPVADGVDGRSAWQAESLDISHRWLSEHAAVFAIELTGAFIADLEGGAGRVQAVYEHAFPRRMKPKLFLILKRAHGGQHPEMVMQRGDAHARDLCEFLHAERLREVCFDPGDRLCRPVALISERGNRAQARSLGSTQNSVDNLALNQAAQNGDVLWSVEQLHKPATRIKQLGRRLGRCRKSDFAG
jgi:hypothetical protein